MSNESGLTPGSTGSASPAGASAVGQTANIGRATSVSSGAAKVFREFKWGLLTLFLLMVVVVGLVYDGGRKKKNPAADAGAKPDDRAPEAVLDSGPETGSPPIAVGPTGPGTSAPAPVPAPKAGPPIILDTQPPPPVPNPPAGPRGPDVRGADPRLAGNGNPPPKLEQKPPAPSATEKTYTVVAGDTLTSIAGLHLLGLRGVKAILDANKDVLTNPNKLRVGMTLKIPTASATTTEATPAKKTTPEAGGKADAGSDYVVQTGDTLERIARKLFNDGRKWRELYEWNRDQLPDPSRLRVGQVLKVKQSAPNTAGTLPAPSAPRAATEEPAPVAPSTTPTATASTPAQHSSDPQVMNAASPANLP